MTSMPDRFASDFESPSLDDSSDLLDLVACTSLAREQAEGVVLEASKALGGEGPRLAIGLASLIHRRQGRLAVRPPVDPVERRDWNRLRQVLAFLEDARRDLEARLQRRRPSTPEGT